MTLKEQINTATDTLNTLRRDYYQQRATYEQAAAAATILIELRQQVEKTCYGKVKTKLNSVTIARLLRSA